MPGDKYFNKGKLVKIPTFRVDDIQDDDDDLSEEAKEFSNSLSLKRKYQTTPGFEVRKSGFLVKSPSYHKHKASKNGRTSMLDCFTRKAETILKDIRKERSQTRSGDRTTRNSLASIQKLNIRSLQVIESPTSQDRCSETMSRELELVSFQDMIPKTTKFADSASRRTRKQRKTILSQNYSKVDSCSNIKSKNHLKKNIESVTIYKGPVSKGLPISNRMRLSSQDLLRKANSTTSFSYRPPRQKLGKAVGKYFCKPMPLSKYGLAQTTPKRSSLGNSLETSLQNPQGSDLVGLVSPASQTTCSSILKQNKFGKRKTISTCDTFSKNLNPFVPSSRNLGTGYSSTVSFSSAGRLKNPAGRKPGKKNLVLSTQINLTKEAEKAAEVTKVKKFRQIRGNVDNKAKQKNKKKLNKTSSLVVMVL